MEAEHFGSAFGMMKTFGKKDRTDKHHQLIQRRYPVVTLQELRARHSPEKQARIRAFAEELLKTYEANHETYVNARKALEAAEKERRRQKALARKKARAEAAKLRAEKAAAKAKAEAEAAAQAETAKA